MNHELFCQPKCGQCRMLIHVKEGLSRNMICLVAANGTSDRGKGTPTVSPTKAQQQKDYRLKLHSEAADVLADIAAQAIEAAFESDEKRQAALRSELSRRIAEGMAQQGESNPPSGYWAFHMLHDAAVHRRVHHLPPFGLDNE